MIDFQEWLREIEAERARSGLTWAEVCRRAGMPYSTWARIRDGLVSPRMDTIETIQNVLRDANSGNAAGGDGQQADADQLHDETTPTTTRTTEPAA